MLKTLTPPKLPQTQPKVLTEEEMRSVCDCLDDKSALGARLLLIALILLDTDMRASELCTLTPAYTDVDEQ